MTSNDLSSIYLINSLLMILVVCALFFCPVVRVRWMWFMSSSKIFRCSIFSHLFRISRSTIFGSINENSKLFDLWTLVCEILYCFLVKTKQILFLEIAFLSAQLTKIKSEVGFFHSAVERARIPYTVTAMFVCKFCFENKEKIKTFCSNSVSWRRDCKCRPEIMLRA